MTISNQDIANFISYLTGAGGILISVYFGIEARKQRIKNIRFDWEDVQLGAKKLIRKTLKKFQPDLIFASSGPSALVANLMLTEMDRYLPVYVGFSQKIEDDDFDATPSYQVQITTSKWKTFLPNDIVSLRDKKILIVEDCTVSGDTIFELRKLFFEQYRFDKENVFFISLVVTETAMDAKKGPNDYYFLVKDTSRFYMPWGLGIGKDF